MTYAHFSHSPEVENIATNCPSEWCKESKSPTYKWTVHESYTDEITKRVKEELGALKCGKLHKRMRAYASPESKSKKSKKRSRSSSSASTKSSRSSHPEAPAPVENRQVARARALREAKEAKALALQEAKEERARAKAVLKEEERQRKEKAKEESSHKAAQRKAQAAAMKKACAEAKKTAMEDIFLAHRYP